MSMYGKLFKRLVGKIMKPKKKKVVFKGPKGKANEKLIKKRKLDAENDHMVETELKSTRAQRLDKAARQLGVDKSSPISQGKGLNAAIPDAMKMPKNGGNGIAAFKRDKEVVRLKSALKRFDKEKISNDPVRNKITSRLFELENRYGVK